MCLQLSSMFSTFHKGVLKIWSLNLQWPTFNFLQVIKVDIYYRLQWKQLLFAPSEKIRPYRPESLLVNHDWAPLTTVKVSNFTPVDSSSAALPSLWFSFVLMSRQNFVSCDLWLLPLFVLLWTLRRVWLCLFYDHRFIREWQAGVKSHP